MACYIRKDISYNIREHFSEDFENVFLDILLPKTKPILIGVVYRPPDQMNFLQHFSDAINNTHSFDSQEIYILGDLNIDMIRKPPLAKVHKEFCSLHGLVQIIDSPTRITKDTSTLIDHILTNSIKQISQEVSKLCEEYY